MTEPSQKPAPPKRMAVADSIAQALGETTRVAISQIRRIVYQCGTKQALAWLEAAQAREAAGGMLIKDGSRRRTPGGVYFAIVDAEIAPELHAVVFPQFHKKRAKPQGSSAARLHRLHLHQLRHQLQPRHLIGTTAPHSSPRLAKRRECCLP